MFVLQECYSDPWNYRSFQCDSLIDLEALEVFYLAKGSPKLLISVFWEEEIFVVIFTFLLLLLELKPSNSPHMCKSVCRKKADYEEVIEDRGSTICEHFIAAPYGCRKILFCNPLIHFFKQSTSEIVWKSLFSVLWY